MYITPEDLVRLPTDVSMNIRSSGYCVYSVEFTWNGQQKLYSEDGVQARIFQNITSIKDCFRHLPLRSASLYHRSAYDEMIGQPESQGNALSVPVELKTLY